MQNCYSLEHWKSCSWHMFSVWLKLIKFPRGLVVFISIEHFRERHTFFIFSPYSLALKLCWSPNLADFTLSVAAAQSPLFCPHCHSPSQGPASLAAHSHCPVGFFQADTEPGSPLWESLSTHTSFLSTTRGLFLIPKPFCRHLTPFPAFLASVSRCELKY